MVGGLARSEDVVCSLAGTAQSGDGGVGELDASVFTGAEPLVEVPGSQSGARYLCSQDSAGRRVDSSQMGPYLSQKRPNEGPGAG